MKTIISDFNSVSLYCAEEIKRLVTEKSDAVIALSAEPCLYGLFDALVNLHENGALDFSRVRFFTVCELVSSDAAGKILREKLFDRINVRDENLHLLCDESFSDYDELIAQCGGIDALFLGIGNNAQLAFNDSGTPFSSLTHIVTLSVEMKKELEYLNAVSDRGLTMGIKTITEAKNIFVTAFGNEKSTAVFKMLYARNDTAAPAAFLQIPMNVTVLADSEASSKL